MVAAQQQQQSTSSVSELEDELDDSESGEDDVVDMSEPQSPGEGQEGCCSTDSGLAVSPALSRHRVPACRLHGQCACSHSRTIDTILTLFAGASMELNSQANYKGAKLANVVYCLTAVAVLVPPELGDLPHAGFSADCGAHDAPFNVLLTTYTLFERDSHDSKLDRAFLKLWQWSCLVLDEAHAVKNRSARRTTHLNRCPSCLAEAALMPCGSLGGAQWSQFASLNEMGAQRRQRVQPAHGCGHQPCLHADA